MKEVLFAQMITKEIYEFCIVVNRISLITEENSHEFGPYSYLQGIHFRKKTDYGRNLCMSHGSHNVNIVLCIKIWPALAGIQH